MSEITFFKKLLNTVAKKEKADRSELQGEGVKKKRIKIAQTKASF